MSERAKKWNLVIDVDRCMDCNDCFLADKDEFTGNDFPPYSVGAALERAPLDEHQAEGAGPVSRWCRWPTCPRPACTATTPPASRTRRPAPSTSATTAW